MRDPSALYAVEPPAGDRRRLMDVVVGLVRVDALLVWLELRELERELDVEPLGPRAAFSARSSSPASAVPAPEASRTIAHIQARGTRKGRRARECTMALPQTPIT
ncbi:MAG TPA: hypothetical protein VLC09_04150, partial [Polyangiaceae bacterium]|nr:hypothetical protein [Polyangiaceae bacterium]